MELLASLLVGKPLNILVMAIVFLFGYLLLRFTALGTGRHPRSPFYDSSSTTGCSNLLLSR